MTLQYTIINFFNSAIVVALLQSNQVKSSTTFLSGGCLASISSFHVTFDVHFLIHCFVFLQYTYASCVHVRVYACVYANG